MVTDTFNDRIVRFSEDGDYITSFTSPKGLHRPSAVVPINESHFAVKDNKCITIFSVEGYYIKDFGSRNMQRPYGK